MYCWDMIFYLDVQVNKCSDGSSWVITCFKLAGYLYRLQLLHLFPWVGPFCRVLGMTIKGTYGSLYRDHNP